MTTIRIYIRRFGFIALHSLAVLSASGVAWAGGAKPAIRRLYKPGTPSPGGAALVHTAAGSQHLDETHYAQVRDAALEMMKRYPPANHFYLALGRSPVSLYSFLRELNPEMTATFPASDLRLHEPSQIQAQYDAHFEHYIPQDVLRGDRGDIVLFDRSHNQSGSSLAKLKPVLERYLAQKGYKTRVVAVGFAAQGPLMAGVEHISTSTFPGLFLYFNGADHDENVASYQGKHTIGSHQVGDLTANPEHERFNQAMHQRMAADPQLDGLLTSEPHLNGHVE